MHPYNGRLGEWAKSCAKAEPISLSVKAECLELFKQGVGYRLCAQKLGLKPYTVRDWGRRFKKGDERWATSDGRNFPQLFKYLNESGEKDTTMVPLVKD